jgi:hypothetical protein
MSTAERANSSDDVEMLVYVLNEFPIEKVADLLKRAGAKIERELPLSGVVGIRASRSRIGEFERIPGVKLVREGHRFQLPPFSDNFPQ